MKKKELKSVVIEIIEKVNSIDKRLNELEQRATPQETESVLIDEAKRLGHKYDVYSWNHEQNTLYGNRGNEVGHDILFENGVWSDVKPEEKPKIGDVVVMYNGRGNFMCIKLLTELDKLNLEHMPELVSCKLADKELVFDLLFNK